MPGGLQQNAEKTQRTPRCPFHPIHDDTPASGTLDANMNHNGSNPAWVVLQGASASASTSYPSSKAATRSGTSHNNRITKEGYRLVDGIGVSLHCMF